MEREAKRAKFGDGPWLDEEDMGMWEAHGYRCMFVRNSEVGTLCGYVGVPQGHPWFGQHYDHVQSKWNVDVHGGLTFSDSKLHASPDGLWYVGFDTAHCDDLMPMLYGFMQDGVIRRREVGGTYRDLAYVRAETESLAEQAARAHQGTPRAKGCGGST